MKLILKDIVVNKLNVTFRRCTTRRTSIKAALGPSGAIGIQGALADGVGFFRRTSERVDGDGANARFRQ